MSDTDSTVYYARSWDELRGRFEVSPYFVIWRSVRDRARAMSLRHGHAEIFATTPRAGRQAAKMRAAYEHGRYVSIH